MYQGYGLVIVPRLNPTRQDKEEELASLLMRELRGKGIYVSVSHTDIPSASYNAVQSREGQTEWRVVEDDRIARKFRGYMENLVLNKILLLNHCWPFVLSQPLNSDLVIGLDVKNNTAGLMVIVKDGRTFSFTSSDSDQKEQLSRAHVSTILFEYLRKVLDAVPFRIRDITVHRDGRVFDGEKRGIRDALDKLAREGLIEKDYNCNFVEIKKSSRIPVRFFDTLIPQGSMQEKIENPRLGTFRIFGDNAFLCTTGRPFRYNGTTQPIQVVKVEGGMEFQRILDDLFALSCLTWTKPDYCSSLPISIKMTDIRLREVAGEYDEDSLKFLEEELEA
jgi:argonaute-like protein implicated in RNA metabolism and viral defense